MNHRYHTPAPPPAIRRFLAEQDPPTPCLVIDVDTVVTRYRALAAAFPRARIQYAVKANPARAVLRALADVGASFDVASPAEIDLCLAAGSNAGGLSYGNTIKKPADIAHAHAAGVTEYTCEASGDLRAVAVHAPGSQVSVRLLVDPPDSATPFGRKFGCSPDIATDLLVEAVGLGLDPVGVSIHVGSQQWDPGAWDSAIDTAASVFTAAAARGVDLRRLNLGGGLATSYRESAPEPADYAASIAAAVRARFPRGEPELVVEPGRAVVADAGLIRAEVVLVSRKSRGDDHRWVYLDIGRYNGLAETENEAITYSVEPVDDRGGPDGPVVLAGPTCDGDDVLYQRTPYRLPESLRAGDQVDILAAGAYTASYSSVAFNGIPPLRTYCIREGRPTGDD